MREKSLPERYEDLKDRRRRTHDVNELVEELIGAVAEIEQLDSLPGPLTREMSVLLRQLDILALADRVFGDPKKASAWLRRPNKSLGGQTPFTLLKDELGATVVRETLEQIDHGIFA